jgi:hypothetical protein
VDDPEPYESPPIASRFRVAETRFEPGAPQSFALRPQRRTPGGAALDAAEPRPAGGPKFAGSSPIGPPGQGSPRRRPTPTPTPGTITKGRSMSAPRPWPRTRQRLTGIVVVALLAAGTYVAVPHVRSLLADQSIPTDLRAYVHGQGVPYAPAGQGYAVRLPSPPHAGDVLVAASAAQPALVIHRSIVSGAGFDIEIRAVDLSGPTALRGGLTDALHDVALVGSRPTHVRRVVVDGTSGIDYELSGTPVIHARILSGTRHLYVLSVQSTSAGTVLDALTQSLRLSP